ncbi:ROK family protein [Desmospora activa]|uniref:fructokinase n=1 Tax=Desmospora activa DSM 45169 TaxID=1121389 RepID=A0A2T4Z808_9BACL|nr:ROK family protein [Desmospora activa]PTM58028.1 fructokinase [Desmospora activa DSM 45169]
MNKQRVGGLEAGGTKMVCAIGDGNGRIVERSSFATTTPEETVPQILQFFKAHAIAALGVGCFGPIELRETHHDYGKILHTPKIPWVRYPIFETLKKGLQVPIALTTDVNAAVIGETRKGAAQGVDSCLYITVGTGIGAGAIINGKLLAGFSHPEMGHISVKRHGSDTFQGNCPYHSDCLEGLASGTAIEARFQAPAASLSSRQEVWKMEAHYLAEAIAQYILILMPKRIIIGGGVMKQAHLFPLIRKEVSQRMAGYVDIDSFDLDSYISPPSLGDDAGITGSLLLAEDVYQSFKYKHHEALKKGW